MRGIFAAVLTVLGLVATVVAAPSPFNGPYNLPVSTYSKVTVWNPPNNYTTPRVLYARTVELPGNVLLATWENYSPEPPMVYFPIFKSTDNGLTWYEISRVQDQVNGFGLRYQPFLYKLPAAFGGYPSGTILCAGNSIPTDLSLTYIDVYASTDGGYTWKYVSNVAKGGVAIPDDGLTPIWEPFLMLYNNQLVCFYSDQRDPAEGQKLVHQVTSDGKTWGPVVDDVAFPSNYWARPGMTTVTLLPNGSYAMTFEYGGAPGFTSYTFAVYYKIAPTPLHFNASTAHPIIGTDGSIPESSPYITWTPVGGPQGTILVSCGSSTSLWTNRAGGALGSPWVRVPTPQGVAYTRHLRVLEGNPNALLVMGAGLLPPVNNTAVSVSMLDVLDTIGASSFGR